MSLGLADFRRFATLLPVAVTSSFLASSATPAATIGAGVDKCGNHYLTLDGPIETGDPERLAAAIAQANARGYQLDALRLNSHGGLIWEAMAMAAMVRWVQNMATVVQKDAKCESACFGLFAAGHRKHVDPSDNQIGVHSVYELIRKEGAQVAFLKEAGDTTIQMVRILKTIDVPDSIIAKIVTTPPTGMSYLSVDDLREMGVRVTSHPHTSPFVPDFGKISDDINRKGMNGVVFLSPAVVRHDIALNNGSTIPAGTVVVARDDVTLETTLAASEAHTLQSLSLCFVTTHLCTVSYHLVNGPVAVAQLQDASLDLIRQGWQDWMAGRPEWSDGREDDLMPPPREDDLMPPPPPPPRPLPPPPKWCGLLVPRSRPPRHCVKQRLYHSGRNRCSRS
jgi:hypothetical protein